MYIGNTTAGQTNRSEKTRSKLTHFRHDSAGDTYEDCDKRGFLLNQKITHKLLVHYTGNVYVCVCLVLLYTEIGIPYSL